jgi:hypothetical protein
MYEIPIYKAEREAGLEAAIKAQASVCYASVCEPDPQMLEQAQARVKMMEWAKSSVQSHMNLHPFKSLLVSVGWNKNSDVFIPEEVWAARRTPEDQPINLEHDSTKIRGHITGQYPVNADMERLADDLAVDELPKKFHIVTAAVLYKHYEDEDVKAEMKEIIEEMAEGKWYVSMECLLRGFDYAVIDAKGSHSIIPRCDESSFLTKHLRAYGGDGKYQGYKLGRLLRNITFSGKGLVKKPANPESVIFAEASAFSGSHQQISQVFVTSGYSSPSDQQSPDQQEIQSIMPTEIELLKDQLAKANEEKTQAVAALKEVETKKLSDLEGQLKAKAEEATNVATKLAETEKVLTETKAALAEVKTQLETIQVEAKKTQRLSVIKEKLGFEGEKAEKLATSLAALSDEDFAQAADYMAEKVAAYKGAKPDGDADKSVNRTEVENDHGAGHPDADGLKTSPASQPDKKPVKTVEVNETPRQSADKPGTSKVGPMVTAKEDVETDVNESAADASVETAVADTEASLATASEQTDEKVESTRAAIWDFMTAGNYMKHAPRRQAKSNE